MVKARLAPGLDQHRYLIAAPLYHMNALALSKLACAAHATIVLLPQFTARAYIEAIERYRATWLTAVPPMMAMMLREIRSDGAHRPLQRAVHPHGLGAGEPEPDAGDPSRAAEGGGDQRLRHHGSRARWCSARIRKGCSSRKCRSAIRIRRCNCAWSTATTAMPTQGVLEMKCPAVMNGYHNRPDVPPPITTDGYYITGDVFRRDENGFHYFVGRTDDMFVSGGENIYPADVERMLERHPGVAQAAVVPVDDEIKGQKPVAFVIPKAGQSPSEDEIKKFALANAPAYQHPRSVWFVDELPLASTNKVDRNQLMRTAAERVRTAQRV